MIKTRTIVAPSKRLAEEWFCIWFTKSFPSCDLSYIQISKLKDTEDEWIVQYEEVLKETA
jgi:hypothetical protein